MGVSDTTLPRDEDGTLAAHVWPGGYPVFYMLRDDGVLCPACANGENGSIAHTRCTRYKICKEADAQWCIVGYEVHWEGAPMACDHCGELVESAYGDPDACTDGGES